MPVAGPMCGWVRARWHKRNTCRLWSNGGLRWMYNLMASGHHYSWLWKWIAHSGPGWSCDRICSRFLGLNYMYKCSSLFQLCNDSFSNGINWIYIVTVRWSYCMWRILLTYMYMLRCDSSGMWHNDVWRRRLYISGSDTWWIVVNCQGKWIVLSVCSVFGQKLWCRWRTVVCNTSWVARPLWICWYVQLRIPLRH